MAACADKLGAVDFDGERWEKGRLIAETPGAIEQVRDGLFLVKSQGGSGSYRVSLGAGNVECNCPDFVKRNLPCKHAASVRFFLEKQTILQSGAVQSERVPITYEQAWATYDRAQMEEVRLFDMLLADLVSSVEEAPQGKGRPRVPLRDELFCAVQKVYSQLSCRRAHSLFGFAVARGQLPTTHGFVVSSRALNREDVTPILHDMIRQSALPLAALEEGFAPDSTGIQTTSFGAWREEKHGEKRNRFWLKAHALVGVKTHIVVRVIVTGKDGADFKQFEPMVRGASADGFSLREVYADKAYTGRSNYLLAEELGFELYSPFKSNDTPRPTTNRGAEGRTSEGRRTASRLWTKAFYFFQMHREEFEAKYHQRSNVESVFSALKRKFGETLRSKNRMAQENELLAKVLAYNLTVLIHEIFEHGVVPEFLRNPPQLTEESGYDGTKHEHHESS
jgi:hypothetical protein